MLEVKFYDTVDDSLLKFAVIISQSNGKWVFCKHKERDTYEAPGGHREAGEDILETAKRELQEETGLETAYMEQFGCFSDVNRDPRERVITIAYYALVRKSEVKGGDDAADAHWFPIDNIPALAFDHDRILRVAVQTLKERIHFKPIGFELLPEVFTMPQLQELYQSILGVKFDRRNFSNKMLKLGILTEVGERPKDAGSRIPIKYSFNLESYTKLKKEGFRLEF